MVPASVVDQLTSAGIAVEQRLAGPSGTPPPWRSSSGPSAPAPMSSEILVATGADFPDALTAGALGGRTDRPVLLVDGGAPFFGGAPAAWLADNAGQVELAYRCGQAVKEKKSEPESQLAQIGSGRALLYHDSDRGRHSRCVQRNAAALRDAAGLPFLRAGARARAADFRSMRDGRRSGSDGHDELTILLVKRHPADALHRRKADREVRSFDHGR